MQIIADFFSFDPVLCSLVKYRYITGNQPGPRNKGRFPAGRDQDPRRDLGPPSHSQWTHQTNYGWELVTEPTQLS